MPRWRVKTANCAPCRMLRSFATSKIVPLVGLVHILCIYRLNTLVSALVPARLEKWPIVPLIGVPLYRTVRHEWFHATGNTQRVACANNLDREDSNVRTRYSSICSTLYFLPGDIARNVKFIDNQWLSFLINYNVTY